MKTGTLAFIIWVFSAIVLAYGFQNDDNAAKILGGIFLCGAAGLALATLFEKD